MTEASALRHIQGFLSVGDLAAARAALARYAADFPEGTLAPEAAFLAIRVACAARDLDEARRLAGAFVARYPESPLRARASAVCSRGSR